MPPSTSLGIKLTAPIVSGSGQAKAFHVRFDLVKYIDVETLLDTKGRGCTVHFGSIDLCWGWNLQYY